MLLLAAIWRLPRGSNAPKLAAGYLTWIPGPDILYGGKTADLKNWAILGFGRSERRKNCKNAIVGALCNHLIAFDAQM